MKQVPHIRSAELKPKVKIQHRPIATISRIQKVCLTLNTGYIAAVTANISGLHFLIVCGSEVSKRSAQIYSGPTTEGIPSDTKQTEQKKARDHSH